MNARHEIPVEAAAMAAAGSRPTAAPIRILVCALGGEGGGVLAEWLYTAAVQAGHAAQTTSIPGVAQRTGATTYYIEVHPEPAAAHPGRQPVFSLSPVPGELDLLVSSELLESVRQAAGGMTDPARTLVISATARTLTIAEKQRPGDGRLDPATLVADLQARSRAVELLDLAGLAREAGTVISAAMLGAIAASGVLPFARAHYEAAIRAGGKGVEPSLRGFARAFDTLAAQRSRREAVEQALNGEPGGPTTAAPTDYRALGHARVADYQDTAYAALYDQRVSALRTAEAAADPEGRLGGAIVQETARWLALWMAFDDIVRVAALKLAASRLDRVRREAGAGDGDLLRIYDHFKPGVPELAGLLPAALASRLLAWDRRRQAAGHEPWALPLRLGSHTVFGALALRLVAALKPLRRRGSRFAEEQALIERWLAAVAAGTHADPALGLELARCGRLVKGYGSTNERGKATLLHLVDHLASAPMPAAQRAAAVAAAREAALADDAGQALDAALQAHGAPARPLRAQPIRWVRRRSDMPKSGMAPGP